MPAVALASTTGPPVRVDVVPEGADRLVLYFYPRTGRPGEPELTPDWNLIPGARGCTPESCGFRDHAAALWDAGAAVVGVSTQSPDDQREAAERLELPFPLLSDADLALTRALELPVFTVAGLTLLKRLTLVVRDRRIEHVFYPVFPPDGHAAEVASWLAAHPASVPASGLEG
jgi:peroxiredoxin